MATEKRISRRKIERNRKVYAARKMWIQATDPYNRKKKHAAPS